MNTKIARETFLDAMNSVSPAVASNIALQILYDYLIECRGNSIFVTANNLEISITRKIPVIATEGDFAFCIPADKIREIIRESTDDLITMEFLGAEIVIKGEHSRHKVKVLPPDDFPKPEIDQSIEATKMSRETFQRMVDRACLSASSDPLNTTLLNILIDRPDEESIVFVGVDGFRYSIVKESVSEGGVFKATVPAKNILKVAKIFTADTVYFTPSANKFQIRCGDIDAVCLFSDVQFPEYASFPTDYSFKAKFQTASIISAYRQAKILSGENNTVTLNLKDGKVTLFSLAKEMGESLVELPVEVSNENELSIKLNADFMIQALSLLVSPDVTIGFSVKDKPVVIEDGGFTHGILPRV